MPRLCAGCTSEHSATIAQKLRAGESFTSVSLWLAAKGSPLSRNALARHAKHVGVGPRPSGPRPSSGSFLQDVVDIVHADILDGRQVPTVAHAIASDAELARRQEKGRDHDIVLKLALVLTGQVPGFTRVVSPEEAGLTAELDAYTKGATIAEAEAASEAINPGGMKLSRNSADEQRLITAPRTLVAAEPRKDIRRGREGHPRDVIRDTN